MTDYTELVKALRCCGNVNTDCTVCPLDKYNFGMCAEKLYTDAAAAIEDLQAELEKKRAADCWGCKCEKVEPKRGEWLPGREISRSYIGDCCVSIDFEDWRCSICGNIIEIPCNPKYKYCPNCGAKMEVQDGKA